MAVAGGLLKQIAPEVLPGALAQGAGKLNDGDPPRTWQGVQPDELPLEQRG
jgi:hypothetical protein